MSIDFDYINEAAAEGAIRASAQYASAADETAQAKSQHHARVGSGWEGDSYSAFGDLIAAIVAVLQQAAGDARSAAAQLSSGLEQALADERAAEEQARREEEERERAAAANG